jgi:hypothetical protein
MNRLYLHSHTFEAFLPLLQQTNVPEPKSHKFCNFQVWHKNVTQIVPEPPCHTHTQNLQLPGLSDIKIEGDVDVRRGALFLWGSSLRDAFIQP